MKRLLVSLVLAGILGAATGCGASATPEPAAPSREANQTRVPRERREQRPLPKLIAPPPAYGNRVVMARGPSTVSQN